jgi:hypothetical protein
MLRQSAFDEWLHKIIQNVERPRERRIIIQPPQWAKPVSHHLVGLDCRESFRKSDLITLVERHRAYNLGIIKRTDTLTKKIFSAGIQCESKEKLHDIDCLPVCGNQID